MTVVIGSRSIRSDIQYRKSISEYLVASYLPIHMLLLATDIRPYIEMWTGKPKHCILEAMVQNVKIMMLIWLLRKKSKSGMNV